MNNLNNYWKRTASTNAAKINSSICRKLRRNIPYMYAVEEKSISYAF
jgi:hypothetical protein